MPKLPPTLGSPVGYIGMLDFQVIYYWKKKTINLFSVKEIKHINNFPSFHFEVSGVTLQCKVC